MKRSETILKLQLLKQVVRFWRIVRRIITVMNFTHKVTVSFHWIDKIDASRG